MGIRSFSMCLCSMAMLLCACMPLPLYNETKAELAQSRIQRDKAEKDLENLKAQHQQIEAQLQWAQLALGNSEAARNQLAAELKKLQTQITYLKNINQQQQKNIKTLQLELKKRRSVIQLQGKVIELLDDTKKTIETSLKDQIAAQDIEIVEADDRLKVIFVDKILFDSGSVEINPGGRELLMIMAGTLKENPEQGILIEGHTDNVPLSAALRTRFPSNWELSTARAAAVARFFQQEAGIAAERLSACGYSYYRPVATNDTAEGRHQNRRIEIILSPSKND